MIWAARIKDYRSLNGLTQQAMADDFGVDRTTIIRWEKGRDEPALVFRKRILALAPTMSEGVVRGLLDFIDNLDGFATLLDPNFRVLRTTRKHQQMMGYDAAEVYGRPSDRYWSAEMERIIKDVGGLRGYKKLGIHRMDLTLVRQPGERGFVNARPVRSIGRTVAIGDPRNPVCHLTTLRMVEDTDGIDCAIPVILGVDGPIALTH